LSAFLAFEWEVLHFSNFIPLPLNLSNFIPVPPLLISSWYSRLFC